MSEVSSSLPTGPALVYLSDPALPGYFCVRLLPLTSVLWVWVFPLTPLFPFKTLLQAAGFFGSV